MLALATGEVAAAEPVTPRHTNAAYSSWAIDPTSPGSDIPQVGRSLFDFVVTEPTANGRVYRVPFPFQALIERIQALLAQQEHGGGGRIAIIPMGRSLQRNAPAPDFFSSPRIVFAVTGEPSASERDTGVLLKDRLYVGYVEKTASLEVISYNEAAGRFEFQLVKDYRADAQPRVFYANRAICVSCHQNHAPIFSRAIWGETNANARVAESLRAHGRDQGLSSQANIDFPDDIDKSTQRANALVALQTLWREGCSARLQRPLSQRCRAAAFTAVLQFGLSGEQGFDSASPRYRDDFVSTFRRVWSEKWPQGLSVAQSSLPDRDPLGGTSLSYGGSSGDFDGSTLDWITATHVPPDLDPLTPRPAREVWRFAGTLDTDRFISGWSKFLSAEDFRAIDRHLLARLASKDLHRSAHRARCAAQRAASSKSAYRLECSSDASLRDGIRMTAHFDEAGDGRIDWLTLGTAGSVRDITLSGGSVQRAGPDLLLRAALTRQDLTARLADGRALASIEIRWSAGATDAGVSKPIDVHVEAVVVDDFTLIQQAIDRLLAKQPALFDDGPFVRAGVLRALFLELGTSERSWCCAEAGDMPPPRVDAATLDASAIADPQLRPFFRYCALCHLTNERFPPNFLTGSAIRVARALRQCAPRMQVRLGAWHAPTGIKSPMPPSLALTGLGFGAQQWTDSEELARLKAYVDQLSWQQSYPRNFAGPPAGGYEALPPCLPPESID